ncbi:MAG: Glu-tRNA(Gln) amidotransferase subunit GatD [Nanobdellota archaeon]
MAEPGDRVRISSEKGTYEGILMPGKEKVIKLDSGYNIGLEGDIEKIGTIEKKKPQFPEIKHDDKKKNITVLHCGGTVASKVDYKTGGVTARFEPEELISLFPELKDIANIRSRLVKQIMSENMRFSHYNIIAEEIKKEIPNSDGIIITHGTDTMHYTSAALSFMLEDLPVPVIVVGAQRSSDRGSSDAALNIISAARFIAETDFGDIGVCMHESSDDNVCNIMPGTKIRKMHTSRRDAFKTINTEPIAKVGEKIEFNHDGYIEADKNRELKIKPFKDLKIGILKSHPNMYAEELSPYKEFDGLVIEGTGLGQMPNDKVDELTGESEKIIKEIEEMDIPVVMTSQCINGRINMNVYSEGRRNLQAGILGDHTDMTPETAFIKLAWLLSNFDKETAKDLYGKNLRGEITERSVR